MDRKLMNDIMDILDEYPDITTRAILDYLNDGDSSLFSLPEVRSAINGAKALKWIESRPLDQGNRGVKMLHRPTEKAEERHEVKVEVEIKRDWAVEALFGPYKPKAK